MAGKNITYIKVFVDYLDAIEPLGDAERGRLFTALLQYARTGEAPQLNGNERFLFPMMRAQIDRDEVALAEISTARSIAGKKGAQAKQINSKQSKAVTSKSSIKKQNKQMPDLLSKSSYEKDKDYDKYYDKDKDKDNNEDEAEQDFQFLYDEDVKKVSDMYMDKIGTLSGSAQDLLVSYVKSLGADVCIKAIEAAINRNARNWYYIKAILQNCEKNNIRSLADWERQEAERSESKRRNEGSKTESGQTHKKWDLGIPAIGRIS